MIESTSTVDYFTACHYKYLILVVTAWSPDVRFQTDIISSYTDNIVLYQKNLLWQNSMYILTINIWTDVQRENEEERKHEERQQYLEPNRNNGTTDFITNHKLLA